MWWNSSRTDGYALALWGSFAPYHRDSIDFAFTGTSVDHRIRGTTYARFFLSGLTPQPSARVCLEYEDRPRDSTCTLSDERGNYELHHRSPYGVLVHASTADTVQWWQYTENRTLRGP